MCPLTPCDAPADNAGMHLEWTPPALGCPHHCLTFDGMVVAFLMERNDGGWMARLDAHKGIPHPLVTRQCTAFEAGKRGCEAWALRHAERLREEAASRPRLVTRGAG